MHLCPADLPALALLVLALRQVYWTVRYWRA